MSHLVLYDGLCGLCNRAVRFVLRHDEKKRFAFASMQSELGRRILRKNGYAPDKLDTFVLVVNYESESESVLARSDAASFIVRELGGWCRFIGVTRILPRPVRDRIYDLIATNRYSWFGKYDSCLLPEKRHRHRFIDQ